MNEYSLVNFKDPSTYFILMTSTVDYGQPPPNAEWFLLYLRSKQDQCMKHVKFAMFGLGDSEYKEYQYISWEIHNLMIQNGAHEFAEFARIDEQYQFMSQSIEKWMDLIVLKLEEDHEDENEPEEVKARVSSLK